MKTLLGIIYIVLATWILGALIQDVLARYDILTSFHTPLQQCIAIGKVNTSHATYICWDL